MVECQDVLSEAGHPGFIYCSRHPDGTTVVIYLDIHVFQLCIVLPLSDVHVVTTEMYMYT